MGLFASRITSGPLAGPISAALGGAIVEFSRGLIVVEVLARRTRRVALDAFWS